MDCHNRPAHGFPTANASIEKAMATGAISTKLPNIKRVAVQAMTQKEITTAENAQTKIAEFMKAKYADPALALPLRHRWPKSRKSMRSRCSPSGRPTGGSTPTISGTKIFPAASGAMTTNTESSAGKAVGSSECSSCHTLIAQGKGAELEILNAKGHVFKHPDGEPDAELSCADCHNGGIQK